MGKKFRIFVSLVMVAAILCLSGCGIIDEILEIDRQEQGYGDYDNGGDSSSEGHSSAGAAGVDTTLFDSSAVRDHIVGRKGNGNDTVTILMYMNGSNLESEDGEATTDISEMIKAGSSDNVNLLVETLGTQKWNNYGIASDRSQIYEVDGNGLTLVRDNLGQRDCTVASTLQDFIEWGVANYPADRYILLFWDHGGGPVYGFGYDEWNDDEYAALTIDEMQTALSGAGVFFDFIGMDCCIMACLEVCVALYDYCDYCILSEDFESGLGWSYTGWLSALYKNTSISTPDLGKIICDDMVSANEKDSEWGDESILAVIDQSMMKVLWTAWTDFAYANADTLLENNYSREVSRGENGRLLPAIRDRKSGEGRAEKLGLWDDYSFSDFYSDDQVSMSEYYVTDIMALASTMNTQESNALASALNNALVYVTTTDGDSYLTGISVTLPYGDGTFYSDLSTIFTNCGFDSDYVNWLGEFIGASGTGSYYDYDDWDDDWSGWDDYDDDYDWGDWSWFGDDYDDYWDSWDTWDDWDFWGDDDWGFGFDDWDDWGGNWDDWGDGWDSWGDDYDDWGDFGFDDWGW